MSEVYDYKQVAHRVDNLIQKYDTGWINRSDWTNAHIGSDDTKNANSNVEHNLNGNLSELIVKVLISTDGTEANSFVPQNAFRDTSTNTRTVGYTIYYIDADNIKIQTGTEGLMQVQDDGTQNIIASDDWYYKIVVYKINL